VTVSDPKSVRAYGLASNQRAGVYLQHYANHTDAVRDLTVTMEVPKAAQGYWFSPENGSLLGRFEAPAGKQTFAAPAFTVDLALLITSDPVPEPGRGGGAAK